MKNKIRISNRIKSQRMRNVFSQKYDENYVRSRSPKQIATDVKYLQDTLRRSKKAFEKRGLGSQTSKYFSDAINMLKTRGMSPREKAEILGAVTKYTREHRLTISLFEIQKKLTLEALQSDEFSSVVKQSREMSNKDDISINNLSDQELYQVFESLNDIRGSLKKYEESIGQGSGDEFDAAIEVVYSMTHDDGDWQYNNSLSLSDNIIEYLKNAQKKVAGKVFR